MDVVGGARVTVGVVYRVPGHGAVLGCDSRVLAGDGEIITDADEKWLVAGSAIALVAGQSGGLWADLKEATPAGWPALRKAVTDIDAELSHARDYEVLVYDRRADVIWHTDHQGDAIRRGLFASIGCGGGLALGALEASPAPRTLEHAEKIVRRAVKIACRRHSACGGRIRTIIVRGRRGELELR